MNRKNPDKILSIKHLAFRPQFVHVDNQWYLAIVPDWFFSFGDDFRRSGFADEQLAKIKRMEREQSIHNYFRFWASWLADDDNRHLFDTVIHRGPKLEYEKSLKLVGGRRLDESDWEKPEDVLPTGQQRFGEL